MWSEEIAAWRSRVRWSNSHARPDALEYVRISQDFQPDFDIVRTTGRPID